MTPDFAALISQYRAGLEAEIVLLSRLEEMSARQKAASDARDMPLLHRAIDTRDSVVAALVNIEQELREVRRQLSESRDMVRDLPGYAEAVELHQRALTLVTRILETDAESLNALASAEQTRREAARAVEQGETTLAAYRRVVASPPAATLVDKRG